MAWWWWRKWLSVVVVVVMSHLWWWWWSIKSQLKGVTPTHWWHLKGRRRKGRLIMMGMLTMLLRHQLMRRWQL